MVLFWRQRRPDQPPGAYHSDWPDVAYRPGAARVHRVRLQRILPEPERHLLRARDLADTRYAEPIDVAAMAAAAGLSRAHFTRAFSRAFGESPGVYLLTRRLERAAALLRNTDYGVAEVCVEVGLTSVGSFTTSFKRV